MKKQGRILGGVISLVISALLIMPLSAGAISGPVTQNDISEGIGTMASSDNQYQPGWDKWRPSFGIWVVDPDDNSAQRLGNWLYDEAQATYVDAATGLEPVFEDVDGQERSLVSDFSADPLFYTGVDHYYSARLGVVERGILADDVIAYYNAQNGDLPDIEFENYSEFAVNCALNATTNEDPWFSNDREHPGQQPWVGWDDSFTGVYRYFYPDFVIGENNWPANPQGHVLKSLGDGFERPTVLAITSYNDRVIRLPSDLPGIEDRVIDDAYELAVVQDYLISVVDTERAMRIFTGMLPDNSTMPLGSTTEASFHVGSIWITLPSDGVAGNLDGDDPGPGDPDVGPPNSGDLNGDGEVTVSEALATANAVISGIAGAGLSDAQVAALDIDGDGRLTMADVVASLRRALGL
jgi:hypothetical protein